eukprot:Gb_09172 [translate_table: standard]
MPRMASGRSALRQFSRRNKSSVRNEYCSDSCEGSLQRLNWEENGINLRKRVVVVVDESREAELALLWALSHAVNKLDTVTLLYIVDSNHKPLLHACKGSLYHINGYGRRPDIKGFVIANSLKLLCKEQCPEVHVEVVVVEGDKPTTIVSQAKKLEASLLVLGQRKPSLFQRFFPSKKDELVEFCIGNAECLTLGVRKQSSRMGGYLINSRWQKNFWLLA